MAFPSDERTYPVALPGLTVHAGREMKTDDVSARLYSKYFCYAQILWHM